MICKNCGVELEENAVFCGKCGSKVEVEESATAMEQEAEVVEITDDIKEVSEGADVEVAEGEVPPKKKKKKWIKWTAIGLIVALLGTGVVFGFPYINNTFWNIVLSDEDYFKHVVENNASDYVEKMADAYAEVMELYKNGETLQYDGKVTVGQKTKDFVSEYSYQYVDINWLDSISYSGNSGYKDGKLYTDTTINVNGDKFTDYNTIMDEDAMYLDFPGLSDGGLRVEHEDGSEVIWQAISAFYEVSPDKEVFKELYVRYINCLTENITEVEKKSDTITAGTVSKKYTKLSAKIDEKVVEKSLENVLTVAKDDEDIKELITDFCNADAISADADVVYEDFRDGIDDLIDELDINADFEFNFNIWVDAKGDIVGMGVECDDGDVDFEFYYANVLDVNLFSDSAMGTIVEFSLPEGSITFEGTGTLDSSAGKFGGEYTFAVKGMDVADIKLIDLDYELLKKDIFNGKIEITVADDVKELLKQTGDSAALLVANAKIEVNSKTTEKYKYAVDVVVSSNNDTLLTANISTSVIKTAVPKISKYINAKDSKSQLWYTNLTENALNKLRGLGFNMV